MKCEHLTPEDIELLQSLVEMELTSVLTTMYLSDTYPSERKTPEELKELQARHDQLFWLESKFHV